MGDADVKTQFVPQFHLKCFILANAVRFKSYIITENSFTITALKFEKCLFN